MANPLLGLLTKVKPAITKSGIGKFIRRQSIYNAVQKRDNGGYGLADLYDDPRANLSVSQRVRGAIYSSAENATIGRTGYVGLAVMRWRRGETGAFKSEFKRAIRTAVLGQFGNIGDAFSAEMSKDLLEFQDIEFEELNNKNKVTLDELGKLQDAVKHLTEKTSENFQIFKRQSKTISKAFKATELRLKAIEKYLGESFTNTIEKTIANQNQKIHSIETDVVRVNSRINTIGRIVGEHESEIKRLHGMYDILNKKIESNRIQQSQPNNDNYGFGTPNESQSQLLKRVISVLGGFGLGGAALMSISGKAIAKGAGIGLGLLGGGGAIGRSFSGGKKEFGTPYEQSPGGASSIKRQNQTRPKTGGYPWQQGLPEKGIPNEAPQKYITKPTPEIKPGSKEFWGHGKASEEKNDDITRPDFSDAGKLRYNTSIPASIRHNNPGATYPAAWMHKYGMNGVDIIGGGHKIANFPDAISGSAANFDLFYRKYADRSLGNAVAEWSGGNSVDTYLKVIHKEIGLKPNDVITKKMIRENPEILINLFKAKGIHESGKKHGFKLEDNQWKLAFSEFAKQNNIDLPKGFLPKKSDPVVDPKEWTTSGSIIPGSSKFWEQGKNIGGQSPYDLSKMGMDKDGEPTEYTKKVGREIHDRLTKPRSNPKQTSSPKPEATKQTSPSDLKYEEGKIFKVSDDIQQSRPYHYRGVLDFEGKKYNFGSGGRNRGSTPFGEWKIEGLHKQSKYKMFEYNSFKMKDMFDSKIGDTRYGMLIHKATDLDKLYSSGCIAIEKHQWGQFKEQMLDYIDRNKGNPISIRVMPDGSASIQPMGSYIAKNDPHVKVDDVVDDFKSLKKLRIKDSQGKTRTLEQMGISNIGELRKLGGQAFGGGKTDRGTLALAHAIQENASGDLTRFTGFNDDFHSGGRSHHAHGRALDATFDSGADGADAAIKHIKKITKDAGIDENDLELINEYVSPSKGATGGHLHAGFRNNKAASKFYEYYKGKFATKDTQVVATKPNDPNVKTDIGPQTEIKAKEVNESLIADISKSKPPAVSIKDANLTATETGKGPPIIGKGTKDSPVVMPPVIVNQQQKPIDKLPPAIAVKAVEPPKEIKKDVVPVETKIAAEAPKDTKPDAKPVESAPSTDKQIAETSQTEQEPIQDTGSESREKETGGGDDYSQPESTSQDYTEESEPWQAPESAAPSPGDNGYGDYKRCLI